MNKPSTGTIFLPTNTAVALWTKEITGQLSDGMWENSRPHDHWQFWNRLEAKHQPGCVPHVVNNPGTGCWCKKNAYNLAALVPIIGDRMLVIGQKALEGTAWPVSPIVYSMKDLKADLALIKAAMKTVQI